MRLSAPAAALLVLSPFATPDVVRAADPPPAANTTTVFINKGSASSVLSAINKMHAKMEAEGWSYGDMGVYTEDGDLEGVFVTYVKRPAAAAAP